MARVRAEAVCLLTGPEVALLLVPESFGPLCLVIAHLLALRILIRRMPTLMCFAGIITKLSADKVNAIGPNQQPAAHAFRAGRDE